MPKLNTILKRQRRKPETSFRKAEDLLVIQKAEYQKIFLIMGILSLFFFVAYLIKRHSNKTRIVEIKTAYKTETRIAKDIHDELANDVFNVITFTQTQPLSTEKTKETLL